MANEKELSRRIMVDLNSARNDDVYSKIANRDKVKYPKHIDYICQAIRNFDEAEPNNNLNINQIKGMLDVLVDEKLKNLNVKTDIIETTELKEESLEDNIGDEISIEDD